jgi:hypothetical protein
VRKQVIGFIKPEIRYKINVGYALGQRPGNHGAPAKDLSPVASPIQAPKTMCVSVSTMAYVISIKIPL